MEKIHQAGADFRTLTEAIDITSTDGPMMMQIVGTFAEFERAMLREPTRNGLEAARKQGRVGGNAVDLSILDVRLPAGAPFVNRSFGDSWL